MLNLAGVCKSFGSGRHKTTVLEDIAFHIKTGDFVALMGPSGSGKSTLLHIIAGILKATKGTVLNNNKEMGEMDENELSVFRNGHIGFVSQDALLLEHLTVQENVALPLLFSRMRHDENIKERVHHVLREVKLENHAHKLPSQLSGGQIARAAIARALITNPTLVLADEPTGNLDSETGDAIIALFKKLHHEKGITFVIATHDAAIARVAKRVIHIKDGAII